MPENIKEQIRGIVRGETESLSARLDKVKKDSETTNEQLAELTGKIKKFISLTRETTKVILQSVENKVKEALGKDFFEEKPEKKKG